MTSQTTPNSEVAYCSTCAQRVPLVKKLGLLVCRNCDNIIKAVESTDPAQEKLPL